MKYTVGIVHHHPLMLKGTSLGISRLPNFKVVFEAKNAVDLKNKIDENFELPDIVVIDENLPSMDGVATVKWLNERYSRIKIIVTSLGVSDNAIVSMIKAGCCAYLFSDDFSKHLEPALNEVATKGFYYENFDDKYYDWIYRKLKKANNL